MTYKSWFADGEHVTKLIPEHTGKGQHRLGRHINHDPRSRKYGAVGVQGVVRKVQPLATALYHRHTHPFDQGQLGSCTGNATAGLLMTNPAWVRGHRYTEKTAVRIYKLATTLDSAPGSYPPDDTGSDGMSALKAAQQLGLFKGAYRHAFGLLEMQQVLSGYGPVIVGTNWYDSFDSPDSQGNVTISPGAQVRGGHEYEVLGIDISTKEFRCCNSWGDSWGDHGYFNMPWAAMDRLLHEQGDVACLAP